MSPKEPIVMRATSKMPPLIMSYSFLNAEGEEKGMLLRFELFDDNEVIHLDPLEVESILETERPNDEGGMYKVARLTMGTGEKFTVLDRDRDAATRINEAHNCFARGLEES